MKRKNLIVFTITMVLIIFSTVCVFADDGQMPELSIKFESYDIDNDCFSTRSDSYSGDDVFESWLTDWCYLNLQKDGQYCELTSWSFTPDEGYQNDIVRLGEKDVALNEMGEMNAYYELLLGDVGSGVLTVTSGDLSASVHINVIYPPFGLYSALERSTSTALSDKNGFKFVDKDGKESNIFYLIASEGSEITYPLELRNNTDYEIIEGGTVGSTYAAIQTSIDKDSILRDSFVYYVGIKGFYNDEKGGYAVPIQSPDKFYVYEFYSLEINEEEWWLYQSYNDGFFLNPDPNTRYFAFAYGSPDDIEFLSPSEVVLSPEDGTNASDFVLKREDNPINHHGKNIYLYSAEITNLPKGRITIKGDFLNEKSYEHPYAVSVAFPDAWFFYTNEVSTSSLMNMGEPFNFRNPNGEYTNKIYLLLSNGWELNKDMIDLCDGLTITSGGKAGGTSIGIEVDEEYLSSYGWYDFEFYISAQCGESFEEGNIGFSAVYNPASGPVIEFAYCDEDGAWLSENKLGKLNYEAGLFDFCVFEKSGLTSVEYLSPSAVVYTSTSGAIDALEVFKSELELDDRSGNPIAVWELHAVKPGEGYITITGKDSQDEDYSYKYNVSIDLPTVGLYYTNEATAESLIDTSRDFIFRNPQGEYTDTFYLILRNGWSFTDDINVSEGLAIISGGKAGQNFAQLKIVKDLSSFYIERFETYSRMTCDDTTDSFNIGVIAIPNPEDFFTLIDDNKCGYNFPEYTSDIIKVTDFKYVGTTKKYIRNEQGVEKEELGSYDYVEYALNVQIIGNKNMTDAQYEAWTRLFNEHADDFYLNLEFGSKAPTGAVRMASMNGGKGSWDIAIAKVGYAEGLDDRFEEFYRTNLGFAVANKKSKKAVLTPSEFVGGSEPGDYFVAWYDSEGKLIQLFDLQVAVDISEFEKVDVEYEAPHIIEAERIISDAGISAYYQDYNGFVVIDAKLGDIDFNGYEIANFGDCSAVKWNILHVKAPEGYYLLTSQDDVNRYIYQGDNKLETADICIPIRLYDEAIKRYDGQEIDLKNFMDSYALLTWVSYTNPDDIINEKLNYRFINNYNDHIINRYKAKPATGVLIGIGDKLISIDEANSKVFADAGVNVLYNETSGVFSVTVEPGHDMTYEVASANFVIPVPEGSNFIRGAGQNGYGSSLMDYRSFVNEDYQSWISSAKDPIDNQQYIYYPIFITSEYTVNDVNVLYAISNDYRYSAYGFYSDSDDSSWIETVFISGRSELFNTEKEVKCITDVNQLPEILEEIAVIDKDERTAVVTLLPQQTTSDETTSKASFFIEFEFSEADNGESRREIFIPYTILERYFPGCKNLGQAQQIFGSKQVVIGHYSNTVYEDEYGTHFTESEKIIGELEAKGIHFICKSFSPFTITCGMTEDEIGLLSNVSDYTDYGLDDPEPPYVPPYNPPVTPISQEDVKEKVVDGSVEIKPEISGDTASAEMSTKSVEKALKNAVKNDETLVLSVDVSAETKQVELLLPLESLKAVAEASSVDVEIKTDSASIVFDSKVLTSIVEQADREEIKFAIEIKDVDSIKELLESENQEIAIAVNVTITSGEKVISTFGGKALEVHVPVDTKKFEEGRTYAAYIISADGSIEKTIATIKDGKAVVVTTHFSTIVVTKDEKSVFEDVEFGEYYYDAVLWAVQNAVTDGVDDTHFDPNGTAKRGQMVTFLWRAAGCPEPTITECAFTDIDPNEYYYKAVLWAVEKGITDGTSDTTFTPEGTVNRGQAVTFLARMRGIKDDATGYTHVFTDVKADEYYSNAVAWAYENKITDGTSETTFEPDGDCLRGQIVTFLWRCIGK